MIRVEPLTEVRADALAEGDDVFSCGRFRFREHGPAFADSGGVADQLSEHAVAPAALIDAVLAARGV